MPRVDDYPAGPPMASPDGASTPPRSERFDLADGLVSSLSGPAPRLLIVRGPSGIGKSALIRTLIKRLPRPLLFVAYRTLIAPTASGGTISGDGPGLELLIVDPERVASTAGPMGVLAEASSISFAFSGSDELEELPGPIRDGIEGMVRAGGGCVIMDSWNRRTDDEYRLEAGPENVRADVAATARSIRRHLGRLPVHMVMVPVDEKDSHLDSLASGLVELQWEQLDGVDIRVLRLAKWPDPAPPPVTHFFYSLSGGKFDCPPMGGPPVRVSIGSPATDSQENLEGIWPGSTQYSNAFGRLRYNACTGFEFDASTPNSLIRALEVPVIVSVLRAAGRVAWIPSVSGPRDALLTEIGGILPPGELQERIRIFSWSAGDGDSQDGEPAANPNDDVSSEAAEPTASGPSRSEPYFPAIYEFLKETGSDAPSLLLLALDGLKARAAMLGGALDPQALPLILENLTRIPRFHAMIFGRSGDPAVEAMFPNLDTQVRVHQKHGQTVFVSLRPRASAYLLSPQDAAPGFSLLSLT
jgi:hypothetical protein